MKPPRQMDFSFGKNVWLILINHSPRLTVLMATFLAAGAVPTLQFLVIDTEYGIAAGANTRRVCTLLAAWHSDVRHYLANTRPRHPEILAHFV